MIGKSLRSYRIEAKLGAGGMGVVYKAVDSRLGRTAAIKVLSTTTLSAERERRFVQEAKAASSLNHPNIVTIYDVDTQEVDGKPLPLYNLPALLAAPAQATVTLLEGEKCADLAAVLGLSPATTSAHGAKAPQLTDWSPLAGRAVAILHDEGADGAGYAAQAAALLAALDPPAQAHVVRLPGLSDGEDIEQFIAARRTAGRRDAEILAELRALLAPSR